jgi:hypothetical protein
LMPPEKLTQQIWFPPPSVQLALLLHMMLSIIPPESMALPVPEPVLVPLPLLAPVLAPLLASALASGTLVEPLSPPQAAKVTPVKQEIPKRIIMFFID